jgi:hypothetical protein
MLDRRRFLTAAGAFTLALALIALPRPALPHHGWAWTENGEFRLTGIIRDVRLGNPHGVLMVDVEGALWTCEIGQPYRNDRAGLTADMLAPGVEVTLLGHRSADPDERRMKAERVIIDGREHVLYPDRSS